MAKNHSSPTFCVMPFINMATETNGKCKICCVVMSNKYIKKSDGSDFEIHKDDIKEIWNSNYVKNIRQQMLQGEWPSDCFYCKGQETTGNPSPRQSYNKDWSKLKTLSARVAEAENSEGRVSLLPVSLEPRPGILCNLMCITCWSMSSSKVFSERKKAIEPGGTAPEFLKKSWSYEVAEAEKLDKLWSDSEIYLSNVRQCMPHLERLYFTGGEPALIKSNTLLLKELIAQGKTDLLVAFTTNLTLWNQELFDLLPNFKKVEVTCSIDGFGNANEYIRYPSKWPVMVENLKRLLAMPRVHVAIMSVIQNTNIESFIQLLYWLKREGLSHTMLIPTMLQGPSYLRPEVLPKELKVRVIQNLTKASSDSLLPRSYRDILRNILQQIQVEHPESESLLQNFKSYVQFLDQKRGTSFREVFPEFQEYFAGDNL